MLAELSTFFTLLLLEIILGVDNIVFIALITARMKNHSTIRWVGLLLALVFRLVMLFFVSLLFMLETPIFYTFSFQDMIFLSGGVFLLFKGVKEMIQDVKPNTQIKKLNNKFCAIAYIAFIDIVFSVDSLLTAVAITNNMFIIALVFICAITFMAFSAASVSRWIESFPELKTLALVFLVAIGIVLVLDGLSIEFEKSYLYFAFGFSFVVQLCNMARKGIIIHTK